MMHMAFDPGKEAEHYYETLLPILAQKTGKKGSCYFESFSLPTDRFLKQFADAFDCKGSILALSPETGSERLRHTNKSFSFSNNKLIETIGRAREFGLRVDLFFAMGIAGETHDDLKATQKFRRDLCRRFDNIGRIWTSPISMEPAAPWHLDPERFGIVTIRKRFDDYVKASSPAGSGLGYFIPDYFGRQPDGDGKVFESRLKAEKCSHHCGFHPDPTRYAGPVMGRVHCFFMKRRTAHTVKRGIYK